MSYKGYSVFLHHFLHRQETGRPEAILHIVQRPFLSKTEHMDALKCKPWGEAGPATG